MCGHRGARLSARASTSSAKRGSALIEVKTVALICAGQLVPEVILTADCESVTMESNIRIAYMLWQGVNLTADYCTPDPVARARSTLSEVRRSSLKRARSGPWALSNNLDPTRLDDIHTQ